MKPNLNKEPHKLEIADMKVEENGRREEVVGRVVGKKSPGTGEAVKGWMLYFEVKHMNKWANRNQKNMKFHYNCGKSTVERVHGFAEDLIPEVSELTSYSLRTVAVTLFHEIPCPETRGNVYIHWLLGI